MAKDWYLELINDLDYEEPMILRVYGPFSEDEVEHELQSWLVENVDFYYENNEMIGVLRPEGYPEGMKVHPASDWYKLYDN